MFHYICICKAKYTYDYKLQCYVQLIMINQKTVELFMPPADRQV